MKREYGKIFSVRIPTWALGYLVNSDDSGLDVEDRKTVDEWVERTRNGGRINVCPPPDGEPYFSSYPAFGLACDVEDCDKVWWCMYDYADRMYVTNYRFRTRRQALVQLAMDLRSERLPYEPDPGFCPGWLRARTAPEVADLVGSAEAAYETLKTQGE